MRENLLVIDPDKLAAEGLSPIAAGKVAARMARFFLEEGVSFARGLPLRPSLIPL